jgi:hypothetical protein
MGNSETEPGRVDRVEMEIVVSEILEEKGKPVTHIDSNEFVRRILEKFNEYERREVKESVVEQAGKVGGGGTRGIFINTGMTGKVELMDLNKEKPTEEQVFPDE